MDKVSDVKVFKIDNELAEEAVVAKKISDFLGQGFEHSDIWLRRTQRTFKSNSFENQYDLEIIAGSIRVLGKVVNREVVPEKDAVLEKLQTDTGSPVKGENQEVENFDIIFKHITSNQSLRQKKVLHAWLDKSEKNNSIDDAPTNEIENKRL
ncbi:hypothetical protein ABEG75_23890 [Pantoea agglomerans]|uniref:hypothetical protein n=1 Tax=Enterobacter agglomerans TaxID=549 RepID=UPI0010097435|nr:hypothetical protein [Pantoea agglomerans]QAV47685.1 hypothetical protein D1629_24030 [Pantoea agglomerans]QAV52396.1 hypothetical protein D1628_24300 [Pantoea agglomerans]